MEETKVDKHKEMKQRYKQNPPRGGVYQIKNLVNGKIFIGSNPNVEAKIRARQFEMKMGGNNFIKDLQADLQEFGFDNFAFEVLEYLDPDEKSLEVDREELSLLEAIWLEKLQPYGDKGYNTKSR
ncbi:MAG: GIY-YIG nuclease family protein [Syntrophomonadaceae bacterium]|nr:GIY-YIG nuclease family protein [Syntrophomonadaceae bacterium]